MSHGFAIPQGGYVYRPLKRVEPALRGADVLALQNALNSVDDAGLEADGVLGDLTATAVWNYQIRKLSIADDGVAGTATQRALCQDLIREVQAEYTTLLRGGLYGQIETESQFILGNQSAVRSDGNADFGVVQLNSAEFEHALAFNPDKAIRVLAARTATKYDAYRELGEVTDKRAYQLAQGAWNAPAWTDRLAAGGVLTPTASAHVEAYIQKVTAYTHF